MTNNPDRRAVQEDRRGVGLAPLGDQSDHLAEAVGVKKPEAGNLPRGARRRQGIRRRRSRRPRRCLADRYRRRARCRHPRSLVQPSAGLPRPEASVPELNGARARRAVAVGPAAVLRGFGSAAWLVSRAMSQTLASPKARCDRRMVPGGLELASQFVEDLRGACAASPVSLSSRSTPNILKRMASM